MNTRDTTGAFKNILPKLKFPPSDSFTVSTSASVPDLVQRLNDKLETNLLRNSFRLRGTIGTNDGKEFYGKVNQDGFQIIRIANSRNSFTGIFSPAMQGRFIPQGNGVLVVVRMKFHLWTTIVVSFMLIFSGIVAVLLFDSSISQAKYSDLPLVMMPIAFALFIWLAACGSFWFEAQKTRQQLERLFI